MRNFGTQIKKEIISMELVNIFYINAQHNTQIAESPKETIDQYHFRAEHKHIKPEETFSYKAFSLN
jgi:hypothetical protein